MFFCIFIYFLGGACLYISCRLNHTLYDKFLGFLTPLPQRLLSSTSAYTAEKHSLASNDGDGGSATADYDIAIGQLYTLRFLQVSLFF